MVGNWEIRGKVGGYFCSAIVVFVFNCCFSALLLFSFLSRVEFALLLFSLHSV